MTVVAVHLEVVEAAARGYLAQLRAVASEAAPDGRLGRAVHHLIETFEAALERKADLEARQVSFSRSDLVGLEQWQLLALTDQHGLGLGRDDAPVVFMGTEEAYDVEDGGDLALACGLSTLWLSGSKPDVLNAIDPSVLRNARSREPRPYHLHPNDYYRVDLSRGRGTWACIARVLRPDDPSSLLMPPAGSRATETLGDLCYQVDVSAMPSKVASGGNGPSAVRTAFLANLVASFDTASAVVFHGGPSDDARKQIGSAFLGRPVRWSVGDSRRNWLAWDAEGQRAVIHTYALNGRIPYAYLDLVRAKLAELAPHALRRLP